MIVFNSPIKVLLKYKVISDDANRWFRADFDATPKGFEDAVMSIKREDQRGTKDLKLVAKYTDGSIKILAQSKEELDEKVSASTIEKLVKMADRFDSQGKGELADKIDKVISQLKTAHCGAGEQDAEDSTCPKCSKMMRYDDGRDAYICDECGYVGPNGPAYAKDPNETDELINKLEREPFEPELDEEPTDKEITDLWEEEN